MSKLPTSVRRLTLALVGISIVGVALALSAGLSTVQAGAEAQPKQPLGACTTYNYTTSSQATVVPGTTDTGNHCDDCVTHMTLPFPVMLYGQSFSDGYISSNGNLQLTGNNTIFTSACLPVSNFSSTFFLYQYDLRTDCTGCGVYTTVTGSAPTRVLYIEWRAGFFVPNRTSADFELRLSEDSSAFAYIYGHVDGDGTGATIGVQQSANSGYTQYACNNPASVSDGLQVTWSCGLAPATPTPCPNCATASATPTPCLNCGTPIPTATPVSSPTPGSCSTYNYTTSPQATIVAGTTDTGNHCDDCTTHMTLPFPITLYGQSFSDGNISSNGSLQLASNNSIFTNACLPATGFSSTFFPYQSDLRTDCTGCGVYTVVTGTAPNRLLYIEWRAGFFVPNRGSANFEIQLSEASGDFAYIYGHVDGGGTGATIGVQQSPTGSYTQYACNDPASITDGLQITWTGGVCGTPTATPTPCQNCPTAIPTATPTAPGPPSATPTAVSIPCTTATATIVAGTTDTGNHCDDCLTTITLPFPYTFYGQTFTTANISSNGNLQFASASTSFANACLPATGLLDAVLPYWDDLRTDCANCGVYTSVSGVAPNRVFNIEWRTQTFATQHVANFEVRLDEGQTTLSFIYGQVDEHGQSATVGVQKDGTTFEQCACSTGGLYPDLAITFTLPPAPGPTPSATALAVPFSDVHQSDYFYYGVQLLYGRGAISGYDDHTFRPGNSTTRGQLTKIIVRALGWAIDTSNGPHFTDVPVDNPFYLYIETAFHHGVISGYDNHTFLPNGNVTRGQLTKIAVLAAGWSLATPKGPRFKDVLPGSPFYGYIDTAATYGVISGYDDHTFHPGADVTRGQVSKIIALTAR